MRVLTVYILLAFLFTSCTTTIVLSRHAEKAAQTGSMMTNDPDLSTAGMVRANALRDTLKNIRFNAIFATQYKRTKQTAQPTATAGNIAVTEYNVRNGNQLIDSLVKIKNKRFLITGHSNSIPGLIKHIGLNPSMAEIPENDYDNLFFVKIRWFFGRQIKLTETTYGTVSP